MDRVCTSLTPVQVDTWGGWIWINMDLQAGPLREWLEPIASLIDPFEFDKMRYRFRFWGIFDCNWKVALEAFIEVYHVIGLHSDQLPTFGDANSQYDVWQASRHVSRMITLSGVPSPHVAANATPERTLAAAASPRGSSRCSSAGATSGRVSTTWRSEVGIMPAAGDRAGDQPP